MLVTVLFDIWLVKLVNARVIQYECGPYASHTRWNELNNKNWNERCSNMWQENSLMLYKHTHTQKMRGRERERASEKSMYADPKRRHHIRYINENLVLLKWRWNEKFSFKCNWERAYVFHFVTKCLCSTCPTSMVYGIIRCCCCRLQAFLFPSTSSYFFFNSFSFSFYYELFDLSSTMSSSPSSTFKDLYCTFKNWQMYSFVDAFDLCIFWPFVEYAPIYALSVIFCRFLSLSLSIFLHPSS